MKKPFNLNNISIFLSKATLNFFFLIRSRRYFKNSIEKKLIVSIKIRSREPFAAENLLPINIVREIVAAPTRKGKAISDASSSKLLLS